MTPKLVDVGAPCGEQGKPANQQREELPMVATLARGPLSAAVGLTEARKAVKEADGKEREASWKGMNQRPTKTVVDTERPFEHALRNHFIESFGRLSLRLSPSGGLYTRQIWKVSAAGQRPGALPDIICLHEQ